jgi:hypothetical protein
MIDCELRRIAKLFHASEQDEQEVAQRAFMEPLVPLSEIIAHVVTRARVQTNTGVL